MNRQSSLEQITIHPAADLFPMMTPEELQELAADIQTSGLRTPIMLSHDGKQLIDGRNRLAACELAKIEPTFAKLAADDDPMAFIASANLMRRNMTKGQQAMAMGMMYPESEKGGRGKKGAATNPVLSTGFSRTRLEQARAVLRHSRPLAEAVLKGTISLNDALAKVKEQEQYQQSDEAKLTRLQTSAPDLAEQVSEERLKINEAIAALTAREQELREVADRGRRAASSLTSNFVTAVLSIYAARNSGEPIVIDASELAEIDRSLKVLKDGQ
jgi:ParB-like nuclease domain